MRTPPSIKNTLTTVLEAARVMKDLIKYTPDHVKDEICRMADEIEMRAACDLQHVDTLNHLQHRYETGEISYVEYRDLIRWEINRHLIDIMESKK